ncbi:MAG: hypothetical protein K0R54_3316, partial [Clostridiaceae bacterium]|nr:hypothetical protein [Clostridiaceae bacterium]
MEQKFNTIDEMIFYLNGSIDKEEIKLKTETILNEIDFVYKESTENDKAQKIFELVIILKYYLIKIKEYQKAYDFYRGKIDKYYANYLNENEELDDFLLILTEIELLCAMKIGEISRELKLMALLIDIGELSFPEEYNINGFSIVFGKEYIEAYGHFINYLLEKEKIEEKKIISTLLSYINSCFNSADKYVEISYYYILEEIKHTISNENFSEFSYNILNFYSILFGFICKEDLNNQISINEHFEEDDISLRGEYENNKKVYDFCNKQRLNSTFIDFFNSINEDDYRLYLDDIYTAFNTYNEKLEVYTNVDIFVILSELNKLKLLDFRRNMLDEYICNYFKENIDFLFEYKHFKNITDLYSLISDDYVGKNEIIKQFYFQLAYSFNESGNKKIAKELYQDAIDGGSKSPAVYNNLGVIYDNEGDIQRALEFFSKASELDPKDEISKNNKERTEKYIIETKKREQQLKNTYFKKVQKYHRVILFAIHRYSDEVTDDVLHDIIKQDKYMLKRNIKFLLDNDMLQLTQNGIYIINPIVEKLIDEYVNPTLEREIVKVDNSKFYRPIFYHESEISLYRVLIELHFIFPNMSLKTIFDIDKFRELIDQEVLSYLFKAHVDFVVVNTATYFPVLAFEKDSEYNDNEPSKTNNEYKNQIFKTGGIPMIRLRYNSGMDYERLKQEVKDATKTLILEIESGKNYSEVDLLREVDKKKFGITNSSIDLKVVQKEWDNVVGSGIAIKSKVIDVEDRILIIEISNDLKSIIEMSKENINRKMLEKFTFV